MIAEAKGIGRSEVLAYPLVVRQKGRRQGIRQRTIPLLGLMAKLSSSKELDGHAPTRLPECVQRPPGPARRRAKSDDLPVPGGNAGLLQGSPDLASDPDRGRLVKPDQPKEVVPVLQPEQIVIPYPCSRVRESTLRRGHRQDLGRPKHGDLAVGDPASLDGRTRLEPGRGGGDP